MVMAGEITPQDALAVSGSTEKNTPSWIQVNKSEILLSVTRIAMIPNTKGTRVKDVKTDSFFMDSRTMKRMIIASASTVNIFLTPPIHFDRIKILPAEVLRLLCSFPAFVAARYYHI